MVYHAPHAADRNTWRFAIGLKGKLIMDSEQRFNIVGLIWVVLGVVSVAAIASGEIVLGLLAPLIVAILATFFLGVAPGLIENEQQHEKAKRGSQDRLAVLLELMDDEERAEFKTMLKQRILDNVDRAQDGELPLNDTSLADLLHDDGATRSTRQS
jgi:hypothetical protein